MSATFARPAFALALAAMLLRALLPAGWMPSTGLTPALITICTMDGPQRVAPPDSGKPAPDQHTHDGANAPCAFAAAAPFAPLTETPILLAPRASADKSGIVLASAIAVRLAKSAHSPRAPPTLA